MEEGRRGEETSVAREWRKQEPPFQLFFFCLWGKKKTLLTLTHQKSIIWYTSCRNNSKYWMFLCLCYHGCFYISVPRGFSGGNWAVLYAKDPTVMHKTSRTRIATRVLDPGSSAAQQSSCYPSLRVLHAADLLLFGEKKKRNSTIWTNTGALKVSIESSHGSKDIFRRMTSDTESVETLIWSRNRFGFLFDAALNQYRFCRGKKKTITNTDSLIFLHDWHPCVSKSKDLSQ